MRFMPKLGVMHVMTSSSERAHYRWGIGMCEIEHVSQGILDESTARRVEEERVAGCQEHDGTVLHLIPKDIDVFDEEVLAYWMTDEATRGIVARAAVVPVGLTALRHRIRWMFYSQDVAFRVFRNKQVAKSWLFDCWLEHQEHAGYSEIRESAR